MRVTRGLLLALGIAVFVVLTAMTTMADSSPSPAPSGSAATGSTALPGDPSKGETLYAQNCATCHGAALEGGIGPALNPIEKLPNIAYPLSAAFSIDIRPHAPPPPPGGTTPVTV